MDIDRHDEFRTVYLIYDACGATVSVFMKNYQHLHIQRIGGNVSRWNYAWNLDQFLDQSVAFLGYLNHFTNWTDPRENIRYL